MEQVSLGEEIVEAQGLKTLEEAKRFAAAWIDSAWMYASNADYWRQRAEAVEAGAEAVEAGEDGTGSD